jgi:hypothetical protein
VWKKICQIVSSKFIVPFQSVQFRVFQSVFVIRYLTVCIKCLHKRLWIITF